MKRLLAKYISVVLAAIATLIVTTASPVISYRPDSPTELLKK